MTMTDLDDAHSAREWEFCDTSTGECTTVTGVLLGRASSHRLEHNHEPGQRAQGTCHACRWFEVTLIRAEDDYVVSFQGHTSIPGETHRHTVHRTRSPYTVIEVLTQSRDGNTFIPRTSRLALSEAAARDTGIEGAWIDRAV